MATFPASTALDAGGRNRRGYYGDPPGPVAVMVTVTCAVTFVAVALSKETARSDLGGTQSIAHAD